MDIFDKHTTYAVIDLDAVAHNVRAVINHIGPKVELIAVLKANAYGHGAVQVGRVALENGAKRLAVAQMNEGIELRLAGIKAPVLVVGYTLPAQADMMIAYDLTATVNTLEGAQAISARASALGKTVPVHVKVDSGMGRYGLLPEEVLPFVEQISRLPNLDLEGMYTHFAVSDLADKSYTRQQLATFLEVVQAVQAAGYAVRLRHAANSGATLNLRESHLDAVRTGIVLYGMPPSSEVEPTIPLKPVLSLKSHVARVRTLPAGSSISYGRTFITPRAMPIALVPIGYGDGYHRILSNRGFVLIRGKRAPIVGRVCMDQLMVDVSGIEGVAQDDEVVLIGTQQGATIHAHEIAALAETINYEVTTSLLPRIVRIYVRGGEIVEVVQLYLAAHLNSMGRSLGKKGQDALERNDANV